MNFSNNKPQLNMHQISLSILLILNLGLSACSWPVVSTSSDEAHAAAEQQHEARNTATASQSEKQPRQQTATTEQPAVGADTDKQPPAENESIKPLASASDANVAPVAVVTSSSQTAVNSSSVSSGTQKKPAQASSVSVTTKNRNTLTNTESNSSSSQSSVANNEAVIDSHAAGSVLRVVGRATITSADGQIREVVKGELVHPSDLLSTSSRSYVRMKMKDSSYIMVRPDSRLSIDKFKYNKKSTAENKGFYSLLKGGFRAVTGLIKNKKNYRYKTTVATIGIRGTEFSVRVCNFNCYDIDPLPKNGLFLEVHDKKVIITTKAGDFAFTKGQFAYVANNESPAILLDEVPDVFDQAPIPAATPDCDK